MTDGIKITEIKITGETIDRDRRVISGNVVVAVEYGDISLILPVAFSAKESHKEAACDALLRLENLGHFIEAAARVARSEYQCNR